MFSALYQRERKMDEIEVEGNKNYKCTKAQWSDENGRTTSYFKKCHSRQRHQINKSIVCITMEAFRVVPLLLAVMMTAVVNWS